MAVDLGFVADCSCSPENDDNLAVVDIGLAGSSDVAMIAVGLEAVATVAWAVPLRIRPRRPPIHFAKLRPTPPASHRCCQVSADSAALAALFDDNYFQT